MTTLTFEMMEYFINKSGPTYDLEQAIIADPTNGKDIGMKTATVFSNISQVVIPTFKYNQFGKASTTAW